MGAYILNWKVIELGREKDSNQIFGLDELKSIKGRYVYVIETPKSASIRYPNGISNVCYIGRQGERSNGSRILSHAKGWISRHLVLSRTDEAFRVHVCHPRRQNMVDAFKDIEALLLYEFREVFGQLPLFNRRQEAQLTDADVILNSTVLRRRPRSTIFSIDAMKTVDSDVTI